MCFRASLLQAASHAAVQHFCMGQQHPAAAAADSCAQQRPVPGMNACTDITAAAATEQQAADVMSHSLVLGDASCYIPSKCSRLNYIPMIITAASAVAQNAHAAITIVSSIPQSDVCTRLCDHVSCIFAAINDKDAPCQTEPAVHSVHQPLRITKPRAHWSCTALIGIGGRYSPKPVKGQSGSHVVRDRNVRVKIQRSKLHMALCLDSSLESPKHTLSTS